ncbi:MAG TPA: RHS repeat-associated core domain-containing protein [Gemmatimonadaceae bacterium]|nr:RHS repeat-associated core domain-containing protein [Gemmatimonadaceae bacterium]
MRSRRMIAAYECSDLPVVHSLPATITMGRARAPALIYNSRHANPGALLAADVTYSGSTPTSLKATVVMAGQTTVKDFAWSSACSGVACRIVVPISTTQPTGLYPVTLQVSAFSDTTSFATSATVTDTVIVVNRASGPFGAGWWLDGLESLVTVSPTKMLWVGGDGSARLYTRSSDTTVYTVNPAFDRPDTLKRVSGAAQTWRRLMGDNAYVEFDASGNHITTVNAFGWKTTFAYSGGLLQSITLPVRIGHGDLRRYRLWYSTSSVLDSVQAPTASFARITQLTHDGLSRITSVTDPGSNAVVFGYDASNRMTFRRNRLSDTTYFAYDDASALKQSRLSTARTDGPGSEITTTFRAAESRSASSSGDVPTPLASVYTQLDGPRSVGDTTNFIINRWGAPDTVTNALGQRTRLERSNATFPSLVTKVIGPNGFETRAFFNARGLMDSTIAVNPFGIGSNSTTRYAWNPVWNQVDSIVGPTGDRTRTFFNSSAAIPDSVSTGTNASRRVAFTYTVDNQLQSVKVAGGAPDSVLYDPRGNTIKSWSPVGRAAAAPYFTQFAKDALGRDTLVIKPINTGVTDSARFSFDVADRVVRTIVSGPARPYALMLNASFTADTATVVALARTDTTGYDAEGHLVYKRSFSEPDYISQLNEQMSYDAAGRLTRRRVGSGPDSIVYDPAGNVISARQRSGLWVNQTYDVLNRLVQRAVPEVVHASERCENYSHGPISNHGPGGPGCFMIFPFYPNKGDSLRIAADTSRFVYDVAGNMTQANNRYARVRRTYTMAGAIESDTTAIGSYSNPLVDGETHGQKYTYDPSGRRTQMDWDMGPTTYSFTDFGALSSLTNGSNTYRYTYTLQGQVDSLLLGAGVREKRSWDDNGRLVFKTRSSDSVALLVSDSLRYDQGDRIVWVHQESHNAYGDTILINYDGLGAVVARERGNQLGSNVEEFRNDAFGNMIRKRTRSSAGLINTAPYALLYGVTGDLRSWSTAASPGQYDKYDGLVQEFSAGRQLRQDNVIRPQNSGIPVLELAGRYYYGADDKLMVVQRYSWRSGSYSDGTWEEYWYDALGRRVFTRARREPGTTYSSSVSGPLCIGASNLSCRSFTERVWWDGDQSLIEKRTAEGTSDVSNSGTIANINALTLDEPLAVISTNPSTETRIITYDWRGQGMSSVFPNGAGADNVTGSGAAEIDWPALSQAQTYFTPSLDPVASDNNPKKWMGTFVQNGQGTTGMLYRRNRYFDANTARFTQEDPIGIAGGVNQYGFANGDPVNHSDPFGLTDCGKYETDAENGDCEKKAKELERRKNERLLQNKLDKYNACIDDTPGGYAAAALSVLPLGNLKLGTGFRLPGSSPFTSIDRRFPNLPFADIEGGVAVRTVGGGAVKTAGTLGTIGAVVGTFATSYAATTIVRCALEARAP